MRTLTTLISAALLFAEVAGSPQAFADTHAKAKPKPKPSFSIARVTVPESVQQGSSSFSLRVKLSGNPVFPVTLAYFPQACPTKPGGCFVGPFDFVPLVAKFATKTDTLVVKNIKACTLINYPDPVFFDYAVKVKDKKGVVTKAVVKGITCTP